MQVPIETIPIETLPLEILDQIIQETIPESFSQLRCTCKAFYRAGERYFRRHRELRARFHNVDYHTLRHDQVKNAVELLHAIAEDPIAGRYIVRANLSADNACSVRHQQVGDGVGPPLGLLKAYKAKYGGPLRRLVEESSYIAEAGIDPDKWLAKMLDPKGLEATVFLLTLLPNVVYLNLPTGWTRLPTDVDEAPTRGNGALWDIVDVLVRQSDSNDPALANRDIWNLLDLIVKRASDEQLSGMSLGRLRDFAFVPLVINLQESHGLTESSLTSCAPFLALPSLEHFLLIGCHACNATHRDVFYPRYSAFSPNLRELDLRHSAVKASAFADLLSRLPHLEDVRYHHEVKKYSCGRNCDIGAILATIQKHAGRHLRKLVVTTTSNYYNEIGTTLDDMSGFKALQVLAITFDILLGPSYIEGYPEWDGGYQHPGKRKLRLLKDIIPPTVTSLLFTVRDIDNMLPTLVKMLRGFDVERMNFFGLEVSVPQNHTWPTKTTDAIYAIKKLGIQFMEEGEQNWEGRMNLLSVESAVWPKAGSGHVLQRVLQQHAAEQVAQLGHTAQHTLQDDVDG
ncbi:uncharacterized protein E0L32_010003 [Thyridium curvatum]|uniref:F-box domain-containing protein n=1 Tax=Thyridium curvatum TaxID=1093900 RepID=A0A507AP87_9PEZI|nr:uncharacterized protein E0L32_010003 [Thyridium curvatum]TPX08516.1 hypothetical protein E0L32_010003 [Thyridium curvatum]